MTMEQLVILIFFIQLIWARYSNKGYRNDDYVDTDYYYQDDKVNPSIFFENAKSSQFAGSFQNIIQLIDFSAFVNGAEHHGTIGK